MSELGQLNHSTEADFLTIGGKLIQFDETVKLLSTELRSLAEMISGELGLRASQALIGALDRSREMTERTEQGNELLETLRREAVRLKKNLSSFRAPVSTFRTVGVLTRIETARLGNAGAEFGTLADDVKLLAGNVQTRIESALDTAGLLVAPLEQAAKDVAALEQQQSMGLPTLIAGVLASLASFRDIQERVRDSSGRLGAQYEAISGAFTKLIVSIQFHDITRQQIEHVIEALQRVAAGAEPCGPGVADSRRSSAAIIALQAEQLADAEEKFAASVASIACNLEQIADSVVQMAEESRTLAGVSADQADSFFLEMERGCSAVLARLGQCDSAQEAIRATSGGLAQTVGQMRGPIAETESIEIEMLRMALNAAIRAAQLGGLGDTLGVLADSMQRLATECKERSEALVGAIGSVSAAAERLSGQGVGESESGGGAETLRQMRTAAADLHSSGERSFAMIQQIVALGARLSDDLAAARASFSVGALFSETMHRVRAILQEAGGQKRQNSADGRNESVELELADVAQHYTMQAERDVHAGILRSGVNSASSAVLTAVREERPGQAGTADKDVGDDFGDNVELF